MYIFTVPPSNPALLSYVVGPEMALPNVSQSLRMMDYLYNGHFRKWVQDESTLSSSAHVISRIANEGHSIERICHALKWLTSGWSVKATANILRHVMSSWAKVCNCGTAATNVKSASIITRACCCCPVEANTDTAFNGVSAAWIVNRITCQWEIQTVADLTGFLLEEWPCETQQLLFLEALVGPWDFSRISYFMIALSDRVQISHSTKISLLRSAATKEQSRAIRTPSKLGGVKAHSTVRYTPSSKSEVSENSTGKPLVHRRHVNIQTNIIITGSSSSDTITTASTSEEGLSDQSPALLKHRMNLDSPLTEFQANSSQMDSSTSSPLTMGINPCSPMSLVSEKEYTGLGKSV